jgi:hypothetical protein
MCNWCKARDGINDVMSEHGLTHKGLDNALNYFNPNKTCKECCECVDYCECSEEEKEKAKAKKAKAKAKKEEKAKAKAIAV